MGDNRWVTSISQRGEREGNEHLAHEKSGRRSICESQRTTDAEKSSQMTCSLTHSLTALLNTRSRASNEVEMLQKHSRRPRPCKSHRSHEDGSLPASSLGPPSLVSYVT